MTSEICILLQNLLVYMKDLVNVLFDIKDVLGFLTMIHIGIFIILIKIGGFKK